MSQTPLASQPALDTRQFESLAALQQDGQPDVLGEMVALFAREVSQSLAEADRARLDQDPAALARVAHSLKGVCGTVGAERMRGLAVDLETALREGRGQETQSILDALKEEMRQVMAALARYAR